MRSNGAHVELDRALVTTPDHFPCAEFAQDGIFGTHGGSMQGMLDAIEADTGFDPTPIATARLRRTFVSVRRASSACRS